ncbi:hypothetical protein [Planktotalea arctica]|uniref:hypothetical protein n=1 Tax=Planktotalea arctica TaxID=1481893 RepID=UPI00111BCF95|nr:hypothetical protein [Planktotalea arctica]
MKNAFVVVLSIVPFISACVPNQQFFLKNGVTLDRYERDALECVNKATGSTPANTQLGWAPYVGVYTVDANAALRDANVEICMRDKGYVYSEVPSCAGRGQDIINAAQQTGFGDKRRLSQRMSVGADTCVARNTKGELLLYTPE